ncbi:hypothetical protein NDU88_001194 [Pleurodeles waltl]|uniref:Uncharacterized protein n=1 Tax=Pleurodeles waltl TaxID=8319 RepID=A0AAV7MP90_PLEWA|nr:hypothetical protein NDU88_001194 [Pleurodeles waltl]
MSPWRAGLISTHQLNSVGPPKSLYQSRSLCTTPFGTTPGHSFQPPPGTTALSFRPGAELQASPGKISGVGVYNPKVQEPNPRRPPALVAHQSHSRAPDNEVSAGHRQSRWAPETPFAAQAPPASTSRPHSTFRSSGGPRRAPKLSNPRAPAPGDTRGKACLPAQAVPSAAAAPRLSGRAPLLPPTWQHPVPTGTAAPGPPGESRTTRGKPPGLPKAGHRSLLRAEAAERNKERLSTPPS